MVCCVCGSEFCWLCMKEISDLHYLRFFFGLFFKLKSHLMSYLTEMSADSVLQVARFGEKLRGQEKRNSFGNLVRLLELRSGLRC